MVAALYLIRPVFESKPTGSVRLFEGFVSFRSPGARSDGKEDVLALREAIRGGVSTPAVVYSANELKMDADDCLCSAFRVAGIDCGVPAVIKCEDRKPRRGGIA